jgi:hypothetical protein
MMTALLRATGAADPAGDGADGKSRVDAMAALCYRLLPASATPAPGAIDWEVQDQGVTEE